MGEGLKMDRSPRSVAVVGAGAMGAALAAHLARTDGTGRTVTVLGTKFDDAAVDAIVAGRPHPALAVPGLIRYF